MQNGYQFRWDGHGSRFILAAVLESSVIVNVSAVDVPLAGALNGAQDEGDHLVRLYPAGLPARRFVVVEAKAGALHPAEFVRQAAEEAGHFAFHRGLPLAEVTGVAVVKRRGANWRDAYVLTTVRDYFGLDRPALGGR